MLYGRNDAILYPVILAGKPGLIPVLYGVWGASIGFVCHKTADRMSGTPPEENQRPMESNPQTQEYSKPKGGRPKLPDGQQRTHAVKVYFDEENYAKLLKRRKRTGKPLSSIVYELAVNGYVREPLSKELASCVRAMASMANNLNQLAHEAHLSGYAAVEERTRELSEKIAKVLVRVSREL